MNLIRKKFFVAAYRSGDMFEFKGRGKTPQEAIRNLKKDFIFKCAEQAHRQQVSAEKENRGYGYDWRLSKALEWNRNHIKDNLTPYFAWHEFEGTQEEFDNSIEREVDNGYWTPKYEINLGI